MEANFDNVDSTQALLAETDWLRRLAAQLVRDPHRADDLAQETMLSALRYSPPRGRVRPWLAKVARNLASKGRRREQNARQREEAVAKPEQSGSVTDSLEKFATHQAVVNAVMELDEPYRSTLLLRYWEDLPLREVARRMDTPLETTRTRVKRGLAKLRSRLDDSRGSRSAWVLPLLQIQGVREAVLAASPATTASSTGFGTAGTAVTGATTTGALLMTKKLPWILATLIVAALAFEFWPRDRAAPAHDPGEAHPQAIGSADKASPRVDSGALANTAAPRERTASTSVGSLIVALRGSDGAAIANAGIYIRQLTRGQGSTTTPAPFAAVATTLGSEGRTGAEGQLRLENLSPGRYHVEPDRCEGRSVQVAAGRESRCVLTVPRGVLVRGLVVDAAKRPIANARVYKQTLSHHDYAQLLATTDSGGRFELQDVAPRTTMIARADGWQPSKPRGERVRAEPGETQDLVLRLGARGHELSGRVVLTNGRPAAHASVVVAVDEDSRDAIEGLKKIRSRKNDSRGLDREVIFVRCDELGRFSSREVPWGETLVMARGAGSDENQIASTLTLVTKDVKNAVTLTLAAGARIEGRVLDQDGEPYAGVHLESDWRGNPELGNLECSLGERLARRSALSQTDGRFALEGLFGGEHTIERVLGDLRDNYRIGTRNQRVQRIEVIFGESKHLDFRFDRAWQLRVKVLGPTGEALSSWAVAPSTSRSPGLRVRDAKVTNAAGEVKFVFRRPSTSISVHAPSTRKGHTWERLPSWLGRVERDRQELVVRLSGKHDKSAYVRGRVLDPNGAPMRQASVCLTFKGFSEREFTKTDENGNYVFGPLVAGSYRASVYSPKHPQLPGFPFELRVGQDKRLEDLRLVAPARISAEIVDNKGVAFVARSFRGGRASGASVELQRLGEAASPAPTGTAGMRVLDQSAMRLQRELEALAQWPPTARSLRNRRARCGPRSMHAPDHDC